MVYYSASGNTERVAKDIAEAAGADLFEIVPTEVYTSDDLNWTNADSRVSREHDDESLRDVPPADIAGVAVTARTDYKDGTVTDCASGKVTASELKGSNVLRYALADGTVILVRPSGTEPKIKVYILTLGSDPKQRDENIAKYSQWALSLQK